MKQDFTIWRNQILQNPWDISPLKFGMSQDEVIEIFGKPDANYLVGAVYHIMEDKDGNLWFSTKGNGLVKAEPDMNSPQGLRLSLIHI